MVYPLSSLFKFVAASSKPGVRPMPVRTVQALIARFELKASLPISKSEAIEALGDSFYTFAKAADDLVAHLSVHSEIDTIFAVGSGNGHKERYLQRLINDAGLKVTVYPSDPQIGMPEFWNKPVPEVVKLNALAFESAPPNAMFLICHPFGGDFRDEFFEYEETYQFGERGESMFKLDNWIEGLLIQNPGSQVVILGQVKESTGIVDHMSSCFLEARGSVYLMGLSKVVTSTFVDILRPIECGEGDFLEKLQADVPNFRCGFSAYRYNPSTRLVFCELPELWPLSDIRELYGDAYVDEGTGVFDEAGFMEAVKTGWIHDTLDSEWVDDSVPGAVEAWKAKHWPGLRVKEAEIAKAYIKAMKDHHEARSKRDVRG